MDTPRERLLTASGSFYLQLVGIIQSLALGFLLQRTFDLSPQELPEVFWVRTLSCFLIIILVWHEYAIGSMAYLWVVGMLDSFIPFLFALTEYMLIYYTDPTSKLGGLTQSQSWLFSIMLFTAVTVVAYWNQSKKVLRSQIGIEFIHASQGGMKASLITLIFMVALFLLSVIEFSQLLDWLIPVMVLAFVCLHMYRMHSAWRVATSNIALTQEAKF